MLIRKSRLPYTLPNISAACLHTSLGAETKTSKEKLRTGQSIYSFPGSIVHSTPFNLVSGIHQRLHTVTDVLSALEMLNKLQSNRLR